MFLTNYGQQIIDQFAKENGMTKTRVTVESPFAGDRERNRAYLLRAMLDSCARGEAPLASHMLYTQFLDDDIPEQRDMGIECGLAWASLAEKMIFYVDYGMSNGMERAQAYALENNILVVERKIGTNEDVIHSAIKAFKFSELYGHNSSQS